MPHHKLCTYRMSWGKAADVNHRLCEEREERDENLKCVRATGALRTACLTAVPHPSSYALSFTSFSGKDQMLFYVGQVSVSPWALKVAKPKNFAKIPLINSPSLTSGTNFLFFKVKDFLLHLICMDMTWGESLIHHALTLIVQPNSSAWSKRRENEKVFRIELRTNQTSKQTKNHNRSGGESGYPSPLLCNQELW